MNASSEGKIWIGFSFRSTNKIVSDLYCPQAHPARGVTDRPARDLFRDLFSVNLTMQTLLLLLIAAFLRSGESFAHHSRFGLAKTATSSSTELGIGGLMQGMSSDIFIKKNKEHHASMNRYCSFNDSLSR